MNWQQFKLKAKREFHRFMYGRNGVDQLTVVLLTISLLITLVAAIFSLRWLQFFYYLGVILALYRTLSRDLARRRQENQLYLQKTRGFTRGLQAWSRTQKQMLGERKTHRHFKCPNCKQILRVPKGRGKITITCSKCGEKFSRKS